MSEVRCSYMNPVDISHIPLYCLCRFHSLDLNIIMSRISDARRENLDRLCEFVRIKGNQEKKQMLNILRTLSQEHSQAELEKDTLFFDPYDILSEWLHFIHRETLVVGEDSYSLSKHFVEDNMDFLYAFYKSILPDKKDKSEIRTIARRYYGNEEELTIALKARYENERHDAIKSACGENEYDEDQNCIVDLITGDCLEDHVIVNKNRKTATPNAECYNQSTYKLFREVDPFTREPFDPQLIHVKTILARRLLSFSPAP